MTSDSERFSLDDLRALAQVMKDFELGELELARASGERLRLVRTGPAPGPIFGPGQQPGALPSLTGGAHAAPAPAAVNASAQAASAAAGQGQVPPNVTVVNAPLVGTFYRAAGPDSPSFVDVGQRVRKGQTLCIIEAMKLMNELESEVDGVVVACLADNGRPVEYGQPLFHIQRA